MLKSARLSLFAIGSSFLTLFAISLLFFAKPSQAGDLGALVRLDRLAPNIATGGVICATPETAGVENSIQVIFPNQMTVNTTASNWTITTDDIPEGSTPLPGIGTATNVSGKTVTFPSADLATGTQYCFKFNSTNTLTTPSSTGNYQGTLRTRTNANTTIDTRNFGIAIITNDRISVTATVPADPTDFTASLSLTSPTNNGFMRERTTLSYTLNYGYLLDHAGPITVQAEWGLGTLQGNNSPSEDILEYVIGSATNAYNNTAPVIDTLNRTISWEISSIPANTIDQSVQFQLITYDDYTGPLSVRFSVNGRVLGPGTQTADSTITSDYKYSSFITPTPVPTCKPQDCPTPIPSATPTPTPVPDATTINSVDIRTVDQEKVTIAVASNNETTARILYGTSKNALNESLSFPIFSNFHLITLDELIPQTRYYFRIILTDKYGRTTTSDLFVVNTASESVPTTANLDTLIITSNDVVLTDPLRQSESIPRIVIPLNTPYSFKIAVNNFENVKSIRAILRNSQVLGLSTNDTTAPSTQSLEVTEISPGEYIGRLSTTPSGGLYEMILQISDFSGNISEQLASTIYVVDSLRVLNAANKEGVENAKITLYYFNPRLKTYELLSTALTPIKNPSYTDSNGASAIVLPDGIYKAEIEALGYKSETVEFTISSESDINYPTVTIEPLPLSAGTIFRSLTATVSDVLALIQDFLHTLRSSSRFFELSAFIIMGFFAFLLSVAASKRLSVPMWLLPYFALYHMSSFFVHKKHSFIVHGRVITSGAGEPVEGMTVYVGKPSGKMYASTTTNVYGEFLTRIHERSDIRITATKKGYDKKSQVVKKRGIESRISIVVIQTGRPKSFSLKNFLWHIESITASFFEALLIIAFGIQLLFVLEFGWLAVLPFLTISLLNVILWTIHIKPPRM